MYRRIQRRPIKRRTKKKNPLNEYHGHRGKFLIWSINPETGERKLKAEKQNLLMDRTFTYDAGYLYGNSAVSQGQIMHLGIGDDNTAPTSTDSDLGNETYRVPVVTQTLTGTGELTTEFYITATEFSGTIEEFGIFAGVFSEDWNAGAGADTGILLARVLYSDTKTTNEEILVQRIDTFS